MFHKHVVYQRVVVTKMLLSYSMVVPYIRDHGGLGFSGQKYHTQKPASQYHPGALAVLVRYNHVPSVRL